MKTRKITKEEREILMNMQLRSKLSLLVLFYIFGIVLPLLVCMIITFNFSYFYLLIIALFMLYMIMYLIPKLEKNSYLGDIRCFNSVVLNTFCHDIYYYVTEINGLDGNFIDYRYPVNQKLKKDTEVIVIMVEGEKKYKDYIILDKKTKKVLSDYRTRFDLIDC